MLFIASKIVLWLIIATVLGVIIGYLLPRKSSKTVEQNSIEKNEKTTQEIETNEEIANEKSDTNTADDLTKINGVGERIEKSLNELGIYTYEDVANWDKEKIDFINKTVAFKGRTSRENWVKHAKILAKKKDELKNK